MKKCSQCGVKYPDELLTPKMTTKGTFVDVCGICGLNLSNSILVVRQTKLDGEIAEQMRLDAIEFRKKNKIKI
jgi:hypothetical protein